MTNTKENEVFTIRAGSGVPWRFATAIHKRHLGRGNWVIKFHEMNEDGSDHVETLPSLKACLGRAEFIWNTSVSFKNAEHRSSISSRLFRGLADWLPASMASAAMAAIEETK